METATKQLAELKSRLESIKEQKQKACVKWEHKLSEVDAKIAEVKKALDEARWQEVLEAVDRELQPMYLKERRRQAEFAAAVNSWIASAREQATKISAMQAEITELASTIQSFESQLLDSRPDDRKLLDKAIVERKGQAVQECRVAEQDEDAVKILKSLVSYETSGSGVALPRVAAEIYEELWRAGGKLRIRQSDLLLATGIPDISILAARDRLERHLSKMQNDGPLEYSRDGDVYSLVAQAKA